MAQGSVEQLYIFHNYFLETKMFFFLNLKILKRIFGPFVLLAILELFYI